MTIASEAETAIRNYLLYLDDPSQLVDPAEVARLQTEIDTATDPLDKLRLLSKLQRAEQSDEHVLRESFCAHAKTWAEANEVTAASLTALGVSLEVLDQAGFAVPQRPERRARKPRDAARRSSGSPSVTAAQIKSKVAAKSVKFTLADIAADIGGSPMTVRKAITELVDAGIVERLGPSPDWHQPGRAPILFQAVAAEIAPE